MVPQARHSRSEALIDMTIAPSSCFLAVLRLYGSSLSMLSSTRVHRAIIGTLNAVPRALRFTVANFMPLIFESLVDAGNSETKAMVQAILAPSPTFNGRCTGESEVRRCDGSKLINMLNFIRRYLINLWCRRTAQVSWLLPNSFNLGRQYHVFRFSFLSV